ncbi:IS630 family transposase [Belnapia sp. F-4-1]|uniref:IS630 family transposase n=1 Tax=Belnapia sp. F-4-1 TaxID=1545443 RepID=UPI00350F6D5B
MAVTRDELTPAQLRAAARASEDPAQVRRLLAVALVLENVPRQQAAEQCGIDRQTLRDWVHRYNEGGVAGLQSRPIPGRAPLLTPEQKAELKALVVAGPDAERDKVVRWRCADLRAEVARRFGVEVREGTIGGWLHQLGLTRLQPRPYHPKKDAVAQETFKKTRSAKLAGRRVVREWPIRPVGCAGTGSAASVHGGVVQDSGGVRSSSGPYDAAEGATVCRDANNPTCRMSC